MLLSIPSPFVRIDRSELKELCTIISDASAKKLMEIAEASGNIERLVESLERTSGWYPDVYQYRQDFKYTWESILKDLENTGLHEKAFEIFENWIKFMKLEFTGKTFFENWDKKETETNNLPGEKVFEKCLSKFPDLVKIHKHNNEVVSKDLVSKAVAL